MAETFAPGEARPAKDPGGVQDRLNVPQSPDGPSSQPSADRVVSIYHDRTKHRRDRFARGPESIDWSSPPNPFRHYKGAPIHRLPLSAQRCTLPFDALPSTHSEPFTRTSLGTLLELSLALSAWKEQGPDRWALRCNPSSGNLHPTEAYVLSEGVPDLEDALWHYDPLDHALERRSRIQFPPTQSHPVPSGLWVALTSIHWREAWKYGERAFRYCQLDVGHAVGALAYAAACLGWRLIPLEVGSASLAQLLGLHRDQDREALAEPEDAELLLRVIPQSAPVTADMLSWPAAQWMEGWMGTAPRLDRHPMYRWPIIDQVASASIARREKSHTSTVIAVGSPGGPSPDCSNDALKSRPGATATPLAVDVIRQRRSAQAFTRQHVMSSKAWWDLVSGIQATHWPFSALGRDVRPRVHAVALVHRVEGLTPGIYLLPRTDDGASSLHQWLPDGLDWEPIPADGVHPGRIPAPTGPAPLSRLRSAPMGATARLLACTQAIAQDACVAWTFLAEWGPAMEARPDLYREVHREAGLMGQVLYLTAERHGLRGTGIGCFFDDEVHEMLGLPSTTAAAPPFQVVYQFTVGMPLVDFRITDSPPYPPERYHWPRPIDPNAVGSF